MSRSATDRFVVSLAASLTLRLLTEPASNMRSTRDGRRWYAPSVVRRWLVPVTRVLVWTLALVGATVLLAQDRERPFRATLRYGRPAAALVLSGVHCLDQPQVHLAPDGRSAVLVDHRHVRLIDLEHESVMKIVEGRDFAISNDGRRALLLGEEGKVVLGCEDVFTSWAPTRAIDMGEPVASVAFAADGDLAVVNCYGEIVILDAHTLSVRCSIILDAGDRYACALSADSHIISGPVGNRLVDLAGAASPALPRGLATLKLRAVAPITSTRVATISDLGTLAVHDLEQRETIDARVTHATPPLALTPSKTSILAGDGQGGVQVFDARSLELRGRAASVHGPIVSISCSDTGRLLAATKTGRLVEFDLPRLTAGVDPDAHREDVSAVAPSPLRDAIATGGVDKTVRIWDAATGRQRRILIGHEDVVRDTVFGLDGKTLTSTDRSGRAITWDVATGRELARRGTKPREGARPLRDGRWLVAGGDGLRVERNDGAVESILHEGRYFFVALRPDGVHAVAVGGGLDGGLEVWNLESKTRERVIEDASVGPPFALSPDGSFLVTEGRRVWWIEGGWVVDTLAAPDQRERARPSAVSWLDKNTLIVGDNAGGVVRYER